MSHSVTHSFARTTTNTTIQDLGVLGRPSLPHTLLLGADPKPHGSTKRYTVSPETRGSSAGGSAEMPAPPSGPNLAVCAARLEVHHVSEVTPLLSCAQASHEHSKAAHSCGEQGILTAVIWTDDVVVSGHVWLPLVLCMGHVGSGPARRGVLPNNHHDSLCGDDPKRVSLKQSAKK